VTDWQWQQAAGVEEETAWALFRIEQLVSCCSKQQQQ